MKSGKILKNRTKGFFAGLTAASTSLSTIVYADGISSSKIAKGTQKLISDATSWLLVIAPTVTVMLIIYYLIRKGMSDEMEHMYGYQITQELKKASENVFELKEGTLYPMLHGLENARAIESYWFDADNGKKRKYYKLTKEGKKLLKDKKIEWQTYTKAVNSVIGGVCYE